MISSKVRVTRRELVTILCNKLKLRPEPCNRDWLAMRLQWRCFGSLTTQVNAFDNLKRKFVGISGISPGRRDFVRIKSPIAAESGTCLTAQLIMFVEISGFSDDNGLTLPEEFRNPASNDSSVIFALARWLCPHPDAQRRDAKLRPIAPSPLDINHALWKFSTTHRNLLTRDIIGQHISFYEGDCMTERLENAELERSALFDFLEPETFIQFANCTVVDFDQQSVLETITLPFQSNK